MEEFNKNYLLGKAGVTAIQIAGVYSIAKGVDADVSLLVGAGALAMVASKVGDGLFNILKKAYEIESANAYKQTVLEEK